MLRRHRGGEQVAGAEEGDRRGERKSQQAEDEVPGSGFGRCLLIWRQSRGVRTKLLLCILELRAIYISI